MASPDHVTRPTLLLRVRDHSDQQSWMEFVEIYGPLIQRFAISRGVALDTAPDVTQDVLRNVAKAMRSFEYDPEKGTFRSWLFTIIRREIIRTAKKAQRKPGLANEMDPDHVLERLPAEESQDWDRDYQRRLVQWAMSKIKQEFSEKTWRAFVSTAVQGDSPKEVAAELDLSAGSIYVAKSRILKRLTEKVHSVDEDEWELELAAKHG